MENNYSVYQHVTPDGMYYFGQTQNVERRWKNNGAEYKGTSLYPYIEKFGWDNIQHIVLFKEQTRENALWIEDFLIETAREDGVCINKQRSGLITNKEGYYQQRYQQNREKELEQQRAYYQKNRDKSKQYYEQHRDKINEQKREYRRKNRDKINEYRRQRYQKNRDKILEQNRQYRQRKKLEKQLKEVETTLF